MSKISPCVVFLAVCVLAGTVMGELDWKFVPFNSIIEGAFTYDASGNDVVSNEASAFRQTMGSTLSVQKTGGDGINNPISGNMAFYGAFNYTDTEGVLAWAQSIATTPLALEITAHTLYFDCDGDGNSDFDDYFALDARDLVGVDYLQATLQELAQWGCTEIAPGVWMDIALHSTEPQIAISVVMQDTSQFAQDIDCNIIPGSLDGEIAGQWRASGFNVAVVPEPATMALLAFGGIVLRSKRRSV